MPKTLNSITVGSPAVSLSTSQGSTFSFAGTPGFSGSGGVNRYDFKWEVDDGGGYVTIASSGTVLTTSNTNPLTNSNSQSSNSITVTASTVGTYTIRMAGAPTTGGSYTVFSATRSVTVTSASVNPEPSAASLAVTGATPSVVVSDHKLATPAGASLSITGASPSVAVSDHKLAIPSGASLNVTGAGLTISVSDNKLIEPGGASVSITGSAPSVSNGASVNPQPSGASLSLTGSVLSVTNEKPYGGPGIISDGGRAIRIAISFRVRVR